MSERTVIAVVTDLIKSGLTVEQQILVNELIIVTADARAAAIPTLYERERKRVYRARCPGHVPDKRKEPKENNIYINPLEGVQGEPLSRTVSRTFDEFWAAYPRKKAKGAARKAYRNALARALPEEIIAGAKGYAVEMRGKEQEYIKHPATWLNADCWLDEAPKPSTVTTGPWKPFKPEADDPPKPTQAEREAQIAKVLR